MASDNNNNHSSSSSSIGDMEITRINYQYRIKCGTCKTWQQFSGSIPSFDMEIKERQQEWTCKLCRHKNLTTYELGVGNVKSESQLSR